MNTEVKNYISEIIDIVNCNESPKVIADRLQNYHENDLADAYIALDINKRQKMCRILDNTTLANIFEYLEPENAVLLLDEMELSNAVAIASHMDVEELNKIFRLLPKDKRNVILQLLDSKTRNALSLLSTYDEDEIGSHMTTNFVAIPYNLTIKQAVSELIRQAAANDNISTIFVLAEDNKYYGAIDLKDLIRARQNEELEKIIVTSYPYVYGNELISDCIETLKDYSEDSIPILSEDNRLLGVITSMDIVEIIDNELGEDYARLAGLTAEEDLKEPLINSIKKRMPWLLTLLLLGMGVSTVVGAFESVVSQLPLIMAFQSLILDMAGNVGTQSLAVTIRVLMDEQLTFSQKIKLVGKELRVGAFNGIILGMLAFIALGLFIMFVKNRTFMFSFAVSGCIGISLLTSMMVSSLVGTCIPIFFKKIHVDPAVASGPLITTVNDLVAVVCYYGLSWIFLIDLFHFAG
ncbi:MAG: magnesium transporter [Eubacteriales bacterium]|nr:magnesium transporter [Eubacteriales bacterium]